MLFLYYYASRRTIDNNNNRHVNKHFLLSKFNVKFIIETTITL